MEDYTKYVQTFTNTVENPYNKYNNHLIWKARNGEEYTIEEMETDHIKNCLKAIAKGKVVRRERFIVLFQKELARRGSDLGEIIYGEVQTR